MRHVSNCCNVIFLQSDRNVNSTACRIYEETISTLMIQHEEQMCVIFSTLLLGELHDTGLRILWENGKIKVTYIFVFLPSFWQQDS